MGKLVATDFALPPDKRTANMRYIEGTLKGFNVLIRNKVIGVHDYPLRATLERLSKKK